MINSNCINKEDSNDNWNSFQFVTAFEKMRYGNSAAKIWMGAEDREKRFCCIH